MDGEHRTAEDPHRMYLVLRKGAIGSLARAAELAGAAAVACVRDPAYAEAVQAWRARPGKVCLRARSASQWEQVLEGEGASGALAGEPDGEAVLALAPRRRSARGPLLERLQAMSSPLDPLPAAPDRPAGDGRLLVLVNPRLDMSTGKTVAQVAHAAVMAADTGAYEGWVAAGCRAQVVRPQEQARFDALCARDEGLAAKVVDAGLTEVAPGTVTVLAGTLSALWPEP
jgi:peptidyl-tRNA hydrolase